MLMLRIQERASAFPQAHESVLNKREFFRAAASRPRHIGRRKRNAEL